MKCIMQLMDTKTGARSEPMETTRKDFAGLFSGTLDLSEEVFKSQAVVVLMEKHDEQQEYEFSRAPFMMLDTFVKHFSEGQMSGPEVKIQNDQEETNNG